MWVNIPSLQRMRWYFLLLAGIACLVDTLVLLAKFKVNAGTLIPGGIGLVLLFPVVLPQVFARCLGFRGFRLVWRGGSALGLLLLAGLPAFVILASLQQATLPSKPPAAIIILGAGLRDGDQPSPLLANRLEVASGVIHRFPESPVVVSGGRGMLENISEAQAMQHFLLGRGIREDRIWLEDASTSTAENLHFSRTLLQRHGVDVSRQGVLIITSDFHTYRSAQLARHAGYGEAMLVKAPTPISILPNVWLREYLACIKARLRGEI